MKAHQRIIREKIASDESNDLFSNDWVNINRDIKNAKIKLITNKEAKEIILKYEWLGTMGTSTRFCYGIFFDGYLGGVACYGELGAIAFKGYTQTVGENYYNKGIILNRGACVHWAHEHSGSKLISLSLKEIKKKGYKFVVAYADSEAGEIGTLYQATNWYYIGITKDTHHDIYYKSGKMFLGDRNFYVKYGTRSKKVMENFVSQRNDLVLKERKGKGRYIQLLGSKKENKEMMNVLKNKIQSYPKRNYD
tara:strand:- start:40 stop:789 length:750 start_codon:yes stop_codon:yes gene_type:complete